MQPFQEIGAYAKVDFHRGIRQGVPEVIFGEGKAKEHIHHFTGITPAVSDAAIELTEAALKAAKAHNVTVSVDLNFRNKLWSSEKPQKVMTNLMQYVDVCIGNEEDASRTLRGHAPRLRGGGHFLLTRTSRIPLCAAIV